MMVLRANEKGGFTLYHHLPFHPYTSYGSCCPYQDPLYDPTNWQTAHPYWVPDEEERYTYFDKGKEPFVINIHRAARRNNTFRTAIWTGDYLQVTLMNIAVGEDIGLENHPETDQFLRIEQGEGIVQMGKSEDSLTFQRPVAKDSAIMVPAGWWHNLINTGNIPLKLYSIYAPPKHPFGTIHETKAIAEASEKAKETTEEGMKKK